jgi:pimeloyl-ACP methyl ester carboxylesterase
LAEDVRAAVAEDRRADAIKLFTADSGMPPELVEGMSIDPNMQAVAPTMPYDFEVMGDFSGGIIPEDLVRRIDIPTLVIAGGASPEFFRDTATRIAEILPDGRLTVLERQDHGAPADMVAPVVAEFFNEARDDAAR